MKKLLVTFFFIASIFNLCKAQFNTYHPFPDSNAGWRVTFWWYTMCASSYITGYNEYDYYMRGDTIVNGKTYFKLNTSGGYEYAVPYCYPDTGWFCYDSLFCLLREDTLARKIYASFKPTMGLKDTLLYDFTLNKGDTLADSYINIRSNYFYVYSIDSILIGTKYRKQYIIALDTGANTDKFDSIIEGIGSELGLMEKLIPPFEAGWNLSCFFDSSVTFTPYAFSNSCQIFHNCPEGIPTIQRANQPINIFPNPSSGKFTMQFVGTQNFVSEIEVYNEMGERVYYSTLPLNPHTGTFPKGIHSESEIDLRGQPDGVYFYRAIGEKEELIGDGKVIIQR